MTTAEFTICHRAPLLPSRFVGQILAVGDFAPALSTHISRLSPMWHANYPFTHSAAAIFSVAHALAAHAPRADFVLMSQYRKALATQCLGQPDPLIPGLFVMSAAKMDESSMQPLTDPPLDFAVPWPMTLQHGVLAQYASFCPAIDMLEFVQCAVEVDALADDEALSFLNSTTLIPGVMEIGLYPVDWYKSTAARIARVSELFLSRRKSRIAMYPPHKARVIASLTERLGSYYLIKTLTSKYVVADPPSGLFQYIACVNNDGPEYIRGKAE